MQLLNLVRASLVARDSRFRARALLEGREVAVHVPNSGRLRELLVPEGPVWLAPAHALGRKTAYDLALVELENGLVSVDARLPNALFHEALLQGGWGWEGYSAIRREVQCGASRLDFCLTGPTGRCWVEVKSVTLVREGVALFPDAPTARGARHVRELTRAVANGDAAAAVFIVQRNDAVRFRPYAEHDPDLAAALVAAQAAGVQVRAIGCQVSNTWVRLARELPVSLTAI
jgi:sugar fermentation stimulation protein A